MKRLMTTLLFVLLCGTGLCLADGVTVSGKVTFENPYNAGQIVAGSATGEVQLLGADGTVAYTGTVSPQDIATEGSDYQSFYSIADVAAGTYTLSFIGEGYSKLMVYTQTDFTVGAEAVTKDFQAIFDDTRGFMAITVKYGEWNAQYNYWMNETNIAGATVTCQVKGTTEPVESKVTGQDGVAKFVVAKNEETEYSLTVKAEAYLDTAFELKGMSERYGTVDFTSQAVYMREKPLPSVTLSGTVTLGGKALDASNALSGETEIGIKTVKGKLLTSPVTNGQYTFAEVPVGATTFFIYDPDGGYDYTWGTTLSANYAVKIPENGQIALTENDAMAVIQNVDIEQIAVNVSGKITGMSGQASVYLMDGETRVNEVRSNYAGEYTFKGVKPGTYTVTVSAYGYEQKNTPSVTVTLAADAMAEMVEMEGIEMDITFSNGYFSVYNPYTGGYPLLTGAVIELWDADGTAKVAETTAGDEAAYAAFTLKTKARMGDKFLIRITHPDIEDFEMPVTVEQSTISVYPSGIQFKYDGPALVSVVNPQGVWNAEKAAVMLSWQWPEEWKTEDYKFYTVGLTRRASSESGSGTYLTSWAGSLFQTETWPEAAYTDTAAENGNLYIYMFSIRYEKPYSGTLDSAFQVDLRPSYRVDWQVNDATMGKVVSEFEPGDYPEGTYLTLIALPETDMQFGGWFDGEEELSRKDTFSFAVVKDLNMTAVFKKSRLSVVVKAEPETAGTVSGGGEYMNGETVTVKAEANEGYRFTAWKSGETIVSTKAEYTFVAEGDLTLTATFETVKYVLGLAVNDPQAGKVEGSGEYAAGTKVTVKALPNEGYAFVNWTAGEEVVSDQAEYELTVTEDLMLTANFTKEGGEYTLTLTVNNADWGQVTGGGTFAAGTEVTVRATPADRYHFVGWFNGTDTISREAVYTFTLDADLALTAIFAPGTGNDRLLEAHMWRVYSQDGVLVINGPDGSRYGVYDMTGRLAGQAAGAEVRLMVDRDRLYVVRCLTADGRFGVKKIVVR